MAHNDYRDFYQDMLIDHARERHGYGLRENWSAEAYQCNPSCGDEITLRVTVSDGIVETVSWEGLGCSISQASASMLSDLATGTSIAATARIITAFRVMLHSRGKDEGDADVLGDATALSGVSRYPPRVKCAMLAWVALEDALRRVGEIAPPDAADSRCT